MDSYSIKKGNIKTINEGEETKRPGPEARVELGFGWPYLVSCILIRLQDNFYEIRRTLSTWNHFTKMNYFILKSDGLLGFSTNYVNLL